MKKLSIVIIALFAIITCGFTASVLWNLVPETTTISFELPSEGTKGTLSGLRGSIDFDKNDPASAKITASVNVSTLNTGNAQKDKHLLSADFLMLKNFLLSHLPPHL